MHEGLIVLANDAEAIVVDMTIQKLLFTCLLKDTFVMAFFDRMLLFFVIAYE